MIPLIVALYYVDTPLGYWAAFALYVVACITDFFDGYLARHFGQLSNLGRFLDPIADKLLVACIIFMLVAHDHLVGIHVLAGLVILLREIIVSGLREFLADLRVSVPVSRLAKWKTTSQMCALGFLIVAPASPEIFPSQVIGLILIWIAAVLTLVTGFDYLTAGLRHMTAPEPGTPAKRDADPGHEGAAGSG